VRVVWSPLAVRRAGEAATHIAQDNLVAARRWVDGLFAAAATLSRLPERGRLVPELRRIDVRELLYGNYRIISRVEARRVAILTVRHLRRRFDLAEIP